MDWYSHRLANALVGNDDRAATLEVTMNGPEMVFEDAAWFAVAGAEFAVRLNDAAVAIGDGPLRARPGDAVTFGLRRRGARAYVAVAGGFLVAPVLGSRSTHVLSRLGGLEGRALRAGDRIGFGGSTRSFERCQTPALTLPEGGARLRVLPGPHADRFERVIVTKLHSSRYVLSPRCDRMGYRLEGPPLPWAPGTAELISSATVPGAVQVPSEGQPILLMADRATTGGYPMIATVITADLPLAGQLVPGEWIEFVACSRNEALAALREREDALRRVFLS
jgi:antagonist of KipI